jgi:hypothetical protein
MSDTDLMKIGMGMAAGVAAAPGVTTAVFNIGNTHNTGGVGTYVASQHNTRSPSKPDGTNGTFHAG